MVGSSPRGRPRSDRRRSPRRPVGCRPSLPGGPEPGRPRPVSGSTDMLPAMDPWKYWAVTHRDHVICNPLDPAQLEAALDLVGLARGARVVDVACGKGEWLVRCARRAPIRGVGVDASPYEIAHAREGIRREGLAPRIRLLHMDGGAFSAPRGHFDLASCLGASWIFGGHEGTLEALARWTRPGGHVLVEQPFWKRAPDPEYLRLTEIQRE